MRHVTIPSPVRLEMTLPVIEEYPFCGPPTRANFLLEFVWKDPRWWSDLTFLAVASTVPQRFHVTSGVVDLTDGEWEKLDAVARSISFTAAQTALIPSLFGFIRAIAAASTDPPLP